MALLRHRTVNFTDTSLETASNAVDVMTLADTSSAAKLPVYFCSSPFLLDNERLRDIIDNAALHRPQALSVIIAEHTRKLYPDLMLSIQTYCIHNDDVIKLESIDACSSHAPQLELDSLGDFTLLLGPQTLLNAIVNYEGSDKTLIYIPDNFDDQLNLYKLLQLDKQHSLSCLVNTEMYSDANEQRTLAGLVRVMDLAIAQDAQLFRWIESNTAQLAMGNPDALAYLVMQYSSIVVETPLSLLDGEHTAIKILAEAAGEQCSEADVRGMLIAIKTRWAVLLEHLPEGADARVWQLLRSMGCTLSFNSLAAQSNTLANQLFDSSETVFLQSIGELLDDENKPATRSVAQIESALLWLDELHSLQNR